MHFLNYLITFNAKFTCAQTINRYCFDAFSCGHKAVANWKFVRSETSIWKCLQFDVSNSKDAVESNKDICRRYISLEKDTGDREKKERGMRVGGWMVQWSLAQSKKKINIICQNIITFFISVQGLVSSFTCMKNLLKVTKCDHLTMFKE